MSNKLNQLKTAFRISKEGFNLLKQGDLTAGAIALVIGAIVTVAVGIPIVIDLNAQRTVTFFANGTVSSNVSTLSGTTALILGFVPVFMALILLVGAVTLMRN